MAIYTILRLAFFGYNIGLFPNVGLAKLLYICFHGLRFDISAILYVNALFVVGHLLPFPFRKYKAYQIGLKILFFVFNLPALFFAVTDLEFYKYQLKRADIGILGTAKDFALRLGQVFRDFWFLFILGFLLFWAIARIYKSTAPKTYQMPHKWLAQIAIFILGIGLTILGMRGGVSLKPIKPLTAAYYVEQNLVPIVNNTPFNIIHSIARKNIVEPTYFSPQQLDSLCNIYFYPEEKSKFKPQNVVILIVESFSSIYTGLNPSGKSYTPFLDSLAQKGLLCTNAFSNGKQSNQGVPAILASLPVLMHDPYIASNYQQSWILGIPGLLKKKGYESAFFHGAQNGSFNFDSFAKSAGFYHYYGRPEYNNDAHFDGTWGIFDRPFLQFCGEKINQLKPPFVASIFTLSSHQPYALPPGFEGRFKGDELLQSVGYADYALEQFFETVKKQPWYKNTLFVLVADHCGPTISVGNKTHVGRFMIPIVFYHPEDKSLAGKRIDFVTQQSDILPSVMDYLNYDLPYSAFGHSFLSPDSSIVRCAFNFQDNTYQYITNDYALQFDGEEIAGLYAYKTDSLEANNLLLVGDSLANPEFRKIADSLLVPLKAVIQRHNSAMIRNQLLPPETMPKRKSKKSKTTTSAGAVKKK